MRWKTIIEKSAVLRKWNGAFFFKLKNDEFATSLGSLLVITVR